MGIYIILGFKQRTGACLPVVVLFLFLNDGISIENNFSTSS